MRPGVALDCQQTFDVLRMVDIQRDIRHIHDERPYAGSPGRMEVGRETILTEMMPANFWADLQNTLKQLLIAKLNKRM